MSSTDITDFHRETSSSNVTDQLEINDNNSHKESKQDQSSKKKRTKIKLKQVKYLNFFERSSRVNYHSKLLLLF